MLADLVELIYPDAAAADSLAATLRANARAGRYRHLAPEGLAERLTEDLLAGISDQHLRVRYAPQEAGDRMPVPRVAPTALDPIPETASRRARAIFEPENYGFTTVGVMPGNIGLIRLDQFAPLYDVVRHRIDASMTLLAATWALIVDLRENGGGEPSSRGHLMSYLFDRPAFLIDRIELRGMAPEESFTTRELAGPSYGETKPVFVVTSRSTFSAAEAMAYSLQALGRARVVGEVTRGGANPGNFFNIGQGFVAFVPQGRAVNPVTGGNWEGVGVQPDITSSAADALSVAHRAAIEAALEQTDDADGRSILRDALAVTPR